MPISGSTRPVLTLRALDCGYSAVPVVRAVDMTVHSGEIVTILGPNGAGKSTLLKAIVGLVKVLGGTIAARDGDITGMATERIVRSGVGYVPQRDPIFQDLTVAENLRMGAQLVPRRERSVTIERCLALFPELRAAYGATRRAGSLSGGEQTMLGIARALVAEPHVVLLDEISSGLSPRALGAVWGKLSELSAQGVGVVLVEQRTNEALSVAGRGYVLVNGRIAVAGASRYLLSEINLADVFLGNFAGLDGLKVLADG